MILVYTISQYTLLHYSFILHNEFIEFPMMILNMLNLSI